MLRKEAMRDVRSTTGANLRVIMLLAGKSCIVNVTRDGMKNVKMFDQPEMTVVLHHICVS